MTLAPTPASHEAEDDRIVLMLGLLRSVNSKVDEVRSLLSQHRKETYTIEEFSKIVGRSAYTVRRWVAEGKVKAIRVQGTGPRGRLLIPRTELDRLIVCGQGGDIPEVAIG